MEMNRRLGVLLALVGCVAVGSAVVLGRRTERRQVEKLQRRRDLHAWEGEGGSLASTPGRS
jgi:hypothetical protein